MAEEHDLPVVKYNYRIVLLGEPGVGKTTFALRIKHDTFIETKDISTQGAGAVVYNTEVDGEAVTVQLDEPAGQERFRSITPRFYRHADAMILMYSIDSKYTFESLATIADDALENTEESVVCALFGNKCDLLMEIDDMEEREEALSTRVKAVNEQGIEVHCAMSAKTGQNVEHALHKVITKVHRGKKGQQSRKTVIKVSSTAHQENKQGCNC